MFAYEQTYDHELARLWNVVADISEQLNQIRSFVASLRAHAVELKTQALHAGTGFALRRFNLDMPPDEYVAEVERMNNNVSQENIALQNDNKQLSVLLKEYEQTVETVMSHFRIQAHNSQMHELTVTHHYEQLLSSRETAALTYELAANTEFSHSLSRMSELLRKALRSANGEDPDSDDVEVNQEGRGYNFMSQEDDHGLERECELIRLEKENEELRRMLGVGLDQAKEGVVARQILATRNPYPALRRNRRDNHGHHDAGFGLQKVPSHEWLENGQWRQGSPARQYQLTLS